MSGGNGAIAVHAAFTQTGHQAQRNVVALSPDSDADVVTAFHGEAETQRTLLYGSNFVEIQASSGGSGGFGSSQTFTFSNDVDAIGDIYARVSCTVTGTSAASYLLGELALARVIDRVEVMVGNSTWQTMENTDLLAMNATVLGNGAYEIYDAQARGLQSKDVALSTSAEGSLSSGATGVVVAWVPLQVFTAGGPARAHLTAGAPHQSFRIKLTYAAAASLGATNGTPSSLEVQLWARQHIMTNFERDQIRANTVAKSLRLTQHAEASPSAASHTVELDSFSLLASHLVIVAEAASDVAAAKWLKNAELLLNTSSHSGRLEGAFMHAMAPASMGLNVNHIMDGTDTAGSTRYFYVFPIASSPFGSDGCPFNRFDTIRLKLEWESAPARVYVTCMGTATGVYSQQAASLQYHS